MTELRNFKVLDTQSLAVTTSNTTGNFVTTGNNWQAVTSCILANKGTGDCLVVFSTTANPTAPSAAPYGAAYFVPAGAVFTVNLNYQFSYFAAICPTGSATLWLSAGFGN